MKTNRFARTILKTRIVVFCLAVVGMAGIGFSLGDYMQERYGQTTACAIRNPQVPNVSLAEAMARLQY
jgi:hypothetical protein